MLVNTVEDNKNKYSNRDYSRAVLARKIQNMGNPSYRHFCKIVRSNQLRNSPILEEDVRAAEDIFGPSLACLKGKTVRHPVSHAWVELTKVPITILQKYKDVELVGDVMRVNGILFSCLAQDT